MQQHLPFVLQYSSFLLKFYLQLLSKTINLKQRMKPKIVNRAEGLAFEETTEVRVYMENESVGAARLRCRSTSTS